MTNQPERELTVTLSRAEMEEATRAMNEFILDVEALIKNAWAMSQSVKFVRQQFERNLEQG